MLTFDTLDAMLDYFEAHEDECDMWVTETRAYLAEKGDCTKKISKSSPRGKVRKGIENGHS